MELNRVPAILLAALMPVTGLAWSSSALAQGPAPMVLALSEIKREDVPAAPAPDTSTGEDAEPAGPVPMPDPIRRLPLPAAPSVPEPGAGEQNGEPTVPATESEPAETPAIRHDVENLPEPVRRMREKIMEACRGGDLEALRPLIGMSPETTQFSLGESDQDPIAFLKEISGDGEGQEILAILYEVLDAGFVQLDVGTPRELYVWPYFFAVPLEGLNAAQRVELFKIVTAGDYEDMKTYGAYNFYRVGISPEGEWVFFVAGD